MITKERLINALIAALVAFVSSLLGVEFADAQPGGVLRPHDHSSTASGGNIIAPETINTENMCSLDFSSSCFGEGASVDVGPNASAREGFYVYDPVSSNEIRLQNLSGSEFNILVTDSAGNDAVLTNQGVNFTNSNSDYIDIAADLGSPYIEVADADEYVLVDQHGVSLSGPSGESALDAAGLTIESSSPLISVSDGGSDSVQIDDDSILINGSSDSTAVRVIEGADEAGILVNASGPFLRLLSGGDSTLIGADFYSSGTFSADTSGCASEQSPTMFWQKIDGFVNITVPQIICTSDATQFFIDSDSVMPASIRPSASSETTALLCEDAATGSHCSAFVQSTGDIKFDYEGVDNNWTSAGTRTIYSTVIRYRAD